MKNLQAEDVFIPGKFPSKSTHVFADRGSPQRALEKCLRRGDVPVIYGSYGVGKSTLMMKVASEDEDGRDLVYIPNLYKKSLADVFTSVLEHIGYEVQVNTVSTAGSNSTSNVGFEMEGGLLCTLTAKIKGSLKAGQSKKVAQMRELHIKSPTDQKLIQLCEENRVLLVLDELHRAEAPFVEDLSAFVKTWANSSQDTSRICLLGTENDPSRLVIRDPGIGRALEEIQLKRLSDDEALEIIRSGYSNLGVAIDEQLVDRLVRSCVGSPFILQFLCLEMADNASADDRDSVTIEDFEFAIGQYRDRKAKQLLHQYQTAIETTGSSRYRKQILNAMSLADNEYVTMEYLVEQVTRQLGRNVPSTSLSGPLKSLKDLKYGSILRDIERPSGDGRVHNLSAFSDPGMKAIIRMLRSDTTATMLEG